MNPLFDISSIATTDLPDDLVKKHLTDKQYLTDNGIYIKETTLKLCHKHSVSVWYFENGEKNIDILSLILVKLYIKYGIFIDERVVNFTTHYTLPKIGMCRSMMLAVLYSIYPNSDVFTGKCTIPNAMGTENCKYPVVEMFLELGYDLRHLSPSIHSDWDSRYLVDLYQKPELVQYLSLNLSDDEWCAISNQISPSKEGSYESIFDIRGPKEG